MNAAVIPMPNKARKNCEKGPARGLKTNLPGEYRALLREEEALANKIASLENFVLGAPRLAGKKKLENIDVIPPMESPGDSEYRPKYSSRLIRSQKRQVNKRRHKHLALFLVLLTAFGGVVCWLLYQLSAYSLI